MVTLTVALGERSYPIHIGEDLLQRPELLRDTVTGRQVAIITNTTVGPLYGEPVRAAFPDCQVDLFECPDGESHKTLAQYAAIIDWLTERRHNRTTTILALGGGVVGDLAGFVAATYQRGVRFVQIPTTLLAQVDSSVGGKTAVNHPAGKNLIGAFYQPVAVIADCRVFSTLPAREFAAGLAEVVKYGIIADADFFRWLETQAGALLERDSGTLIQAVQRSCEIKAEVVAEDEREGGRRAILNYGHTFGHALEQTLGYGRLLHGEAVAVGMVLASRYASRFGRLPAPDAQRVQMLLSRLGLPVAIPAGETSAEALLAAMGMDKKVQDGRLRLVLGDVLGAASIVDVKEPKQILDFLVDNLSDGHG